MIWKKALFAVSLFAFFSLVVISCKKSNSSSPGTSGQITASINDTAWSTNVTPQGLWTTAADQIGIIGDSYKSGDSTVITLTFTTPFPLNSGISSDTSGVDIEYTNKKTLAKYDGGIFGGHSLLTVNAWDSAHQKIGGIFSGVLYNISGGSDSLVVTNGTFTTTYTVQ